MTYPNKNTNYLELLAKSIKIVLLAHILLIPATLLAESKKIEINIKNHLFEPARVEINAGEKVELKVNNLDSTAEEFESYEFNREKVIAGNSSASIFVGPLTAGEYTFFGEFNQETAKGVLVVK